MMAKQFLILVLWAALAAAAGCGPGKKAAPRNKNKPDPRAVAAVERVQADLCNINSAAMWERVDQAAEFNIRSEYALYPEKFQGKTLEQAMAQMRETMRNVRAEHPAPAYSVCEFDPPGFADCGEAFRGDLDQVAPEFRAQSDEDLAKIQAVLKDMGVTRCAVFAGRTREQGTDLSFETDVVAGLRGREWVLLSFTAAGSPARPEPSPRGGARSRPAPDPAAD